MLRGCRLLVATLLISLAAYLLILATAGFWRTPRHESIPPSIGPNLRARPAQPVQPTAPKALDARPLAPTVIPTAAVAAAPPDSPAAPAIPAAPATPIPAVVAATPIPVSAPTPAPALKPAPQHPLPERVGLRYAVQTGEDGFSLGRATYAWRQHDGHYSLVSSAVASGLVSLFVSGQMVQSSEGEITSAGLRPDLYGISRNGRKPDTTRFDWGLGKMRHGDEDAELPPGSQDVLGFPFHLAMTVDESIREWHLWVSNGRKLQDYLFHNLGREHLKFGEAEVETLHLQGSRAGEGTLDVWLAPSRHWLPLRIRTLDQKGKVLGLSLEEVS